MIIYLQLIVLKFQVAKWNVERSYSVVGITSHLDISIKVMEDYLPRFFSGASSIYKKLIALNNSKIAFNNWTPNKKPVSEHAMLILRMNNFVPDQQLLQTLYSF